MTQRTFQNHISRHPEIPEYVQEAKQTISDPDIVMEADNGAILLYRRGLGRRPFTNLWLTIVIYYRGTPSVGTVATYYFTDEIADGRPVENRAAWIAGERFPLAGSGETGNAE
jgi:hypothetical protein